MWAIDAARSVLATLLTRHRAVLPSLATLPNPPSLSCSYRWGGLVVGVVGDVVVEVAGVNPGWRRRGGQVSTGAVEGVEARSGRSLGCKLDDGENI